ncbi:MAG: DUF5671 domain-containing protein [Chloroflexota bacterium]
MVTVRRWYIFLVCAVSLQTLTWAGITLLNTLVPRQTPFPREQFALEVAIILISLPVYLVHWLWGQALARRDDEERGSLLRRIYLYAMLAAFLVPFLVKAYDMIDSLFLLVGAIGAAKATGAAAIRAFEGAFVLAVFWFYHYLQVKNDERVVPAAENTAVIRRLYVLSFSAVGLILVLLGVKGVLLSFLYLGQRSGMSGIKQIIIGLPLWLAFWRSAQCLFDGPSAEEKASTLRKFYLYAWVFAGALLFVANASLILAGTLRRLLGLPSRGDVRDLIPLMIVMATAWAYHSWVLRQDVRQAGEVPHQAALRRLYLYLMAGIGLVALLTGLAGVIHVLIRLLGGESGRAITEQFVTFTATLLAGLPVWLLPWQKLQGLAGQAGSAGSAEHRSVIRKIYLYLFVFAATMAVLASATYIAYFFLSKLMGVSSDLRFTNLAQALAFTFIALGVWLYHGFAIRRDGQRLQNEQTGRLATLPVLVLDDGSGLAGQIIANSRREIPGIAIEMFLPEAGTPPDASSFETLLARVAEAGLFVLPWQFAQPTSGLHPQLAEAIASSQARKLLLPTQTAGWDWVGVDRWDEEPLVRQAVAALKQVFAGEDVHPVRPLGLGTIAGILLVIPFAFWVIVTVISILGQYIF